MEEHQLDYGNNSRYKNLEIVSDVLIRTAGIIMIVGVAIFYISLIFSLVTLMALLEGGSWITPLLSISIGISSLIICYVHEVILRAMGETIKLFINIANDVNQIKEK